MKTWQWILALALVAFAFGLYAGMRYERSKFTEAKPDTVTITKWKPGKKDTVYLPGTASVITLDDKAKIDSLIKLNSMLAYELAQPFTVQYRGDLAVLTATAYPLSKHIAISIDSVKTIETIVTKTFVEETPFIEKVAYVAGGATITWLIMRNLN
jgi:hypothetical protein